MEMLVTKLTPWCLAFVVVLGVVAAPPASAAAAQAPDAAGQELLQRFQQNKETNHDIAHTAAVEYLQRYPNDSSAIAEQLRLWVDAYRKAVAELGETPAPPMPRSQTAPASQPAAVTPTSRSTGFVDITENSQWGPSAGMMLGTFNSNELTSVKNLVKTLTDYDSSFTGRSWDLCAARGRSGASYVRLCYTQLKLEDGGGLFDELGEGVTRGVLIKGFKADRMWRLGPASWPVAPALTLHGGLGKVSGTVFFNEFMLTFDPRTGRSQRQLVSSSERPAGEFLGFVGNDWTVIGGASVGATATLGSHATVSVGVYGLEFPGIYKGQVQFVYWPIEP